MPRWPESTRTLLTRVASAAGALALAVFSNIAIAQPPATRPAAEQAPTEQVPSEQSPVARPTGEQVAFFENKIRVLLAARCVKCHGPEKQEAGLRVDTLAGLLTGGDSGPALSPSQPEASLLLAAVGYGDDVLRMPPDGKLPAGELALLRDWVRQGAPHADGLPRAVAGRAARPVSLEVGRRHWAFQPPRPQPLPVPADAAWARTPIDLLLLAKMETAGLRPAPPASKGALLRRATFDLHGLPPTAEEMAAFEADAGEDAFARVVDRLLASPRYGERWGRHWLDVARYADSNGLDENIAHGNAWRYRDHVVQAFNSDQPYDEFLVEQIAGDLLPVDPALDGAAQAVQRNQRLIATGFLALGPKVLAEVDETKMEMDIIDERLSALSQAVLGVTLGCARCHDHKFDPFSQHDYYALAGVFKSTRTMEHFKKIARWHENPVPTPEEAARRAEHAARVDHKKRELADFLRRQNELLASRSAGEHSAKPEQLPAQAEEMFDAEAKARLTALRKELAELEKAAPETSTAMGVTEEVGGRGLGSRQPRRLLDLRRRHVPVGRSRAFRARRPPPQRGLSCRPGCRALAKEASERPRCQP